MKKFFDFSFGQNGFALSVDAFFALVLLIALIGFVGTGSLKLSEDVPVAKVSTLGQNLEDALTSFENTGFLAEKLNPVPSQSSIDEIYSSLLALLPSNTGVNISVEKYAPKVVEPDLQNCRDLRDFNSCFELVEVIGSGEETPLSGEILSGRKIIMQKQAGRRVGAQDKCILSGAADFSAKIFSEPKSIIFFDSNDSIIQLGTVVKDDFGIEYTAGPPVNALQCYDPDSNATEQKKQIANIHETVLSGARQPVSIMLLVDRSGSMSTYDMKMKSVPAVVGNGTCEGGACHSCPLVSKDTDYALFTNKQNVTTYNLTQATINSVGVTNKLLFVLRPNDNPLYGGNCPAINSMVLWVTRPDSFVEKDSGRNTVEDVIVPFPGNYVVSLWNDAVPADTYSGVFLAKSPLFPNYYNAPVSATTTWQNLGAAISIPHDSAYKLIYNFSYNGYGGSSYPRFRVRRDGWTVDSVNCGPAGASSGNCSITVENSYPLGNYADDGSYQVQFRLNSGSGIFNVDANVEMESCVNSNCNPAVKSSGSIGSGTCSGATCANCPKGSDLSGTSTATNVQSADVFSVGADSLNEHYRGILANITSVENADSAVCNAGIGFSNPIEGANKNFNFIFPPNGDYCFEISENGLSSACDEDRINGTVPLQSGDYNLLSWSDVNVSFLLEWEMQRIDALKKAAKSFLDNAQWKTTDKFGLTYFANSTSSYSTPSGHPMTNDLNAVKTSLNTLDPNGNTPVAVGLNTARAGLSGEPANNSKFIILLTDGMANVRYPTSGCCPGGGSGCSSTAWPCVLDAIAQADQARQNDITVFVIGIADSAVFQGTVTGSSPSVSYETALKQLAKDQDDSRYTAQCLDVLGDPVPEAHCGKYYFAQDANQLAGIYELIVQEIGERVGAVDIHLLFPPMVEVLCNSSCSTGGLNCSFIGTTITCSNEIPEPCTIPPDCDGGTDSWHETSEIIYLGQNVSTATWDSDIKARIPCDSGSCVQSTQTFPAPGAFITTESGDIFWGGPGTVCSPDCNKTVPFYYNDLKAVITDGTIIASDIVELTVEIRNNGFKQNDFTAHPLLLSFHSETEDGQLITVGNPGIASDGFLVALENISGINHVKLSNAILPVGGKAEIKSIQLGTPGLIYLVINSDNNVKQCVRNDSDWSSCAEPETFYYVIGYSAWSKT